jgi:hypothetical protein
MQTTYTEYIEVLNQWNLIMLFCFMLAIPIARLFKNLPSGYETLPASRGFWLAIVSIALLVRLPLMFDAPWYDETYTRAMALVEWNQFAPALLSDVHPPLFYVLERVLVAILGASPFALRLPSLIAGLAILPVIYRLTIHLDGYHSTAKIATILAVLLPMPIYYSTEARYPMLLALVVLLAMLAIIEDKPGRFVLLAALPVYLHTIGVFYAAWLVIGALAFHNSMRWFKACVLAGLLGILWLPGLIIQLQIVSNGFWLKLEYPITYLIDMTTGRLAPHLALMVITFVMVYVLSCRALWYRFVSNKRAGLWALIALGVPLTAWLVSVVSSPIYLPRSLIASTLLFLPLWADVLRRSKFIMLIGAILLCCSLYGLSISNRAPIADAFKPCTGAENIYATSKTMAIPALYFMPDVPITIWKTANDIDLTTELTPDIQRALKLNAAASPAGLKNVCIVAIIDPYTSQLESDVLNELAGQDGAIVQWVNGNTMYKFVSIRFEE